MLHVLLFLGSYITGSILAFFYSPVFAFVVYQVVYFFNPSYRWWGYSIPSVSYSFFAVLLMLILVIKNYKTTKTNHFLIHPQFRWLFLLLLLYAITSYYAVYHDAHIEGLIFYAKLVITMMLAYKLCDTDQKLEYVIYGYMFGAWYLSFLTFQSGRNSGDRVEGIGMVDAPDSNGAAAALAPALVFFLYYFWTKNNIYGKLLIALGGAFTANALILINSRGAFLGGAVGVTYFLFYMYFSGFQRKYQKTVTILIVLIGLSGFLYLIDDSFIERINTMKQVENDGSQETGSTRIYFWLGAMDMAKDYPFGKGFKAFQAYAPIYIPADINTGYSANRAVHSTWFEVLTEIGYLGLFAFIMMIYSTFKALRLCKAKLKEMNNVDNYFKIIAIEGALLSFIVSMTFLNRMRAEILHWLILFSICAYNIYVIKNTNKKNNNALQNEDKPLGHRKQAK